MDRRLIVFAGAIAVSAIFSGCSASDAAVTTSPTSPLPTNDPATTAPFFSFDGYGGIRIGMTRAEAEAAAAFPLAEYGGNNSCTWLADKRVVDRQGDLSTAIQITLDTAGRVIVVAVYRSLDARTDRGVGVGSTVNQIAAAYAEPREAVETAVGHALTVAGPHGNDLSFALDDAGVRAVGIGVGPTGYVIGFEVCSG